MGCRAYSFHRKFEYGSNHINYETRQGRNDFMNKNLRRFVKRGRIIYCEIASYIVSGGLSIEEMDDSSILRQCYDNQPQSGIKQEPALPPTLCETFRTSYHLFLTWLLIGALVCGIIFGPVLVMYLKQQRRCTHIF